jgi:hypothetical protein
MKKITFVSALLAALALSNAWADGPVSAYDNGGNDQADVTPLPSLSPGEQVMTDQEDQQMQRQEVQGAYSRGYNARAKEEADRYEQWQRQQALAQQQANLDAIHADQDQRAAYQQAMIDQAKYGPPQQDQGYYVQQPAYQDPQPYAVPPGYMTYNQPAYAVIPRPPVQVGITAYPLPTWHNHYPPRPPIWRPYPYNPQAQQYVPQPTTYAYPQRQPVPMGPAMARAYGQPYYYPAYPQ